MAARWPAAKGLVGHILGLTHPFQPSENQIYPSVGCSTSAEAKQLVLSTATGSMDGARRSIKSPGGWLGQELVMTLASCSDVFTAGF